MDTDMGMAMDTARKIRVSNVCLAGIILLPCTSALAADMEFTPSIEGEIIYTDNVDLAETDKESSEITTLTAELQFDVDGNDGNISFDYEVKKLIYSHDSDENELYHELDFTAEKGLFSRVDLKADIGASITNVSKSITENASTDVVTSDTTETKSYTAGLEYQSNDRGIADLNAQIEGTISDNEDSVGDSSSYEGQLTFEQGDAVKKFFWTTDYSYNASIGDDSSDKTESHELDQEFGLQQINGFSPFVHYYYEDYSGQGDDDSADSSTWGPGIKYFFDKNSYVEFTYEMALDDNSSNYWRGSLYLSPTTRTTLEFDYTQRFYGDAYDFSLSHQNRRVTNTITYSEEVTNYNTDLIISGNQLSELSISKTLTWNSTLNLRRTKVDLELSADQQEAISDLSDNTDVQTYSSDFSIAHDLSRTTTITPSFTFEYYDFDTLGVTTQKDYYREWELELSQDFASDLSVDFTLSHNNRSSTEDDLSYKENRVSLNVRKEL